MSRFNIHYHRYNHNHEFDYRHESNWHTAAMIVALVVGYTIAKCCDGCRTVISVFKARK